MFVSGKFRHFRLKLKVINSNFFIDMMIIFNECRVSNKLKFEHFFNQYLQFVLVQIIKIGNYL